MGEKRQKFYKCYQAVSKLVNRVEQDILDFKFNTTISALMEFYNEFHNEIFSQEDLEKLIIISSPVFPHLSEEVWEKTGHDYSVHMQDWPEIDEKHLEEEEVEIPVQINGKVRARIKIRRGASEDEVYGKAESIENVQKYIKGKQIIKKIYIKDRLLNIVVK